MPLSLMTWMMMMTMTTNYCYKATLLLIMMMVVVVVMVLVVVVMMVAVDGVDVVVVGQLVQHLQLDRQHMLCPNLVLMFVINCLHCYCECTHWLILLTVVVVFV